MTHALFKQFALEFYHTIHQIAACQTVFFLIRAVCRLFLVSCPSRSHSSYFLSPRKCSTTPIYCKVYQESMFYVIVIASKKKAYSEVNDTIHRKPLLTTHWTDTHNNSPNSCNSLIEYFSSGGLTFHSLLITNLIFMGFRSLLTIRRRILFHSSISSSFASERSPNTQFIVWEFPRIMIITFFFFSPIYSGLYKILLWFVEINNVTHIIAYNMLLRAFSFLWMKHIDIL